MSKARELAELGAAYDRGNLSNRNLVINGAMQVAQRGTSSTGIGASIGYYTLDRYSFILGDASAGRLTMTQEADGPVGFANCLKLACTTADTSIAAGERLFLQHKIEAQNCQAIGKGETGAKPFTVSFYVKANAAKTYGLEVFQSDHSRQCTKLFNVTTDWTRVELTFPADVDDGSSPIADDNGEGLVLQWQLHAGSNYTSGTLNSSAFADNVNANRAGGIDSFFSSTSNTFFITGIQLEVGDTATPFEHRSFDEEFRRCSRYYQHSNSTGVKPTNGSDATSFGTGYRALANVNIWGGSTAGRVWEMVRDAPMRATPTGTKFGNDSGYYACIVHGSTSAPNSDNTVTFHENLMLRTEDACFISFDNQSSGNTVWGVMGGFELDAEL